MDMPTNKRDDFSAPTKDALARRVGLHCSNPACWQITSGPADDPRRAVSVGVAAHITAASPDGPRYDPGLTPEQRGGIDGPGRLDRPVQRKRAEDGGEGPPLFDADESGIAEQFRQAAGDVIPGTGEAVEQQARLGYVCELLRRLRRPLCPVNGLLALLPYDLILRGPREAIELERCVKRDMDALREGLMLRCPVTGLVVGMEEDAGFRELVRRVGRERGLGQRFGKGFSLWNPPIRERLTAVCLHACGAFEDWIYALFAERGSLSKPGNTKLFALLCNMRRNVQSRLAKIVANGFGFDPEVEPDHEPLLFGGLYFAATGETEDRQAFVKSVFEKLPEQQEEIEWMEAAQIEDSKYRTLALWAYGLDTLLLAGLVGMFVYRWLWAKA